jgi:flagellar basal-body rod protein FlgB
MDQLSNELSMMSKLMDAAAVRTRVIAHNMANVNTPGFKRSEVNFEASLSEAIKKGDRALLEKLEPEVQVTEGGKAKPDGNNVYMEDEIADLVKTTILYNTLNRLIDGKISSLKLAIRGG